MSHFGLLCFNLFFFLPPGTKYAHDEEDDRGISPRTRWLGADGGVCMNVVMLLQGTRRRRRRADGTPTYKPPSPPPPEETFPGLRKGQA